MNLDIGTWALGAVIVVGLIQWFKGMLPKAPTWVWIIASPLAAVIGSAAYGTDKIAWNALGILAVSQMGYELILQTVKSKLSPPSDAKD